MTREEAQKLVWDLMDAVLDCEHNNNEARFARERDLACEKLLEALTRRE